MSLRVWLPLTKDLRNQGLDNVTVTNNGVTFNTAGKLGGCYQFGNGSASSNGLFLNSNLVDVMQEEYSVAVWVKPLGNHYHYNGTIFSSGDWNKTRYSFGLSQDNSQVDILCKGHNNYLTCAVPINTWTHLICTCDSNNVVRLYKNGEYINFSARNDKPDSDNANQAAIGRETYANGYFTFNGMLNDFRLYDHCLSPLEVKQISQGLILHYPLNREGWGQENLALNTHNLNLYSNKNNLYMYFRGAAIRRLRADGFYEAYCTGNWQGLSFWANQLNLKSGDKITYSFYIYTNGTSCGYGFYLMIYNSSGSRDTSTTFPISIDGDNYINGNSRTFGNTTTTFPEKHYVTFEWNDSVKAIIDNGGSIELSIQVSGGNWTNRWACIYAPKIEKGDKITPWCPNSSDILATTMGLNNNIEYDVSGYENNGTKNNITYTSDTPKYNVSSIFNGTNSYVKVNDNNWMVKGMTEMTVNLWAKATAFPASGRLVSCTERGGFNLEAGNSGYWRFPIYVYTNSGKTSSAYKYDSNEIKLSELIPNEWNMITLIYDTNGTKTYLNGELHHTYTNISYGINFNTNARLFLGCEANTASPSSPYFNGQESDFRIYATALSADDVKSLYQNSAYIDNQGNIYGAVYEEV